MAIFTINNVSELVPTLSAAADGDTVFLNDGVYGKITLQDINFAGAGVTIKATNAFMAEITPRMLRCDGLHWRDLVLPNTNPNDTYESQKYTEAAQGTTGSIKNCHFRGANLATGAANKAGYGTGIGLCLNGCGVFIVENCLFETWYRACYIRNSDGPVLRNNELRDMRSDGINVEDSDNGTLEGNYWHSWRRAMNTGDHADGIQFWTSNMSGTDKSEHWVIRGNCMDKGPGDEWFQGLFMGNEQDLLYNDFLIEDNVFRNGHLHGITIAQPYDNIIIQNNVCVPEASDDMSDSTQIPGIRGLGPDTGITISGNYAAFVNHQQGSNTVVSAQTALTYDFASAAAPIIASAGLTSSGGSGPTNIAPVAVDDTASCPFNGSVIIDVTANDTDSDGTIDVTSVTITSNPSNGTVGVNPGTGEITYTPDTDFQGQDSFTYFVADNDGDVDTATVTVDVSGPAPVAPVVNDGSLPTPHNTPVIINVLAGSVIQTPSFSLFVTTGPDNGTAAVNSDSTVTYTPDDGFSGVDAFVFTVIDGNGLTGSGTITVTTGQSTSVPDNDALITAINSLIVALGDLRGALSGTTYQGINPTNPSFTPSPVALVDTPQIFTGAGPHNYAVPAGTNRMVVALYFDFASSGPGSHGGDITFGGTAMLSVEERNSNGSGYEAVEAFVLPESLFPSGADAGLDFVLTSEVSASNIGCVVFTVENADQSTTIAGWPASVDGNHNNPTGQLVGGDNDLLIGFAHGSNNNTAINWTGIPEQGQWNVGGTLAVSTAFDLGSDSGPIDVTATFNSPRGAWLAFVVPTYQP